MKHNNSFSFDGGGEGIQLFNYPNNLYISEKNIWMIYQFLLIDYLTSIKLYCEELKFFPFL